MRLRHLVIAALVAVSAPTWADKPDIPAQLRHQVRMTPAEGLPDYPTLALDDRPVVAGGGRYVSRWVRPLPQINQVGGVVADARGYAIVGTALHAEDVSVRFDRDAVARLMGSPFSLAGAGDDDAVFTTTGGGDIAVSLIQLTPEGEIAWVSTFENDLVSAGPLARLRDGRLLMALTPVVIEDDADFSSFLFIVSAEGKVLERREFRNVLFNGLAATADGRVLAGVVRREVPQGKREPSLRQYAWFLDGQGRRTGQVALADHPGDRLVYKVLSLIEEYDDAYVLSGGDSVFVLDKRGGEPQRAFLRPTQDLYADYHIQAVQRDRDHNLIMFGFHGREKSPLTQMQLDYLQSVTRPTTPGQELSEANMRMRKNPLLRGVYNDMLQDMRARSRERGTPFNAVLTTDGELINLVDRYEQSTEHTYAGAASTDGHLFMERIHDGAQAQYYLLDPEGQLLIRDQVALPMCERYCRLDGTTLVHIDAETERTGLVFKRGVFELAGATQTQPNQTD